MNRSTPIVRSGKPVIPTAVEEGAAGTRATWTKPEGVSERGE